MRCLHPHCRIPGPASTWADVAAHPLMKVRPAEQAALAADLQARFGPLTAPAAPVQPPAMTVSRIRALLTLCPCLFNQIAIAPNARAVVHFCEMTLGKPVTSANVYDAFTVQLPGKLAFSPPFAEPPRNGGTIMEMLCSEVLSNEGLPEMPLDAERWPQWKMPGHILLNEGRMASLKAFGDILIPCAPTNIVISVKSVAARERLLYSANSIEGIGFGFFNQPNEFWTVSRMALYKRMGFSAIYMPDDTHASVMAHLEAEKSTPHAVNINGTPLYRPLTVFGADMRRIVGRSSMLL